MTTVFRNVQRHFRKARMREFLALFPIKEDTRILDVGGTPDIWSEVPIQAKVTLCNLPASYPGSFSQDLPYVAGDGCRLPFPDRSFDIVFSNSVIEHVGSADAQRRFAAEISRVGKSYWVQTPNRYFPIEMHMLTPLVHWLPRRVAAGIIRRFSIWALIHRPSAEQKRWYYDHFLEQIRLLSHEDLARLFPDASVRRESFCGMSKSWIATRVKDLSAPDRSIP